MDNIELSDGSVREGDQIWYVGFGINEHFEIYNAKVGQISKAKNGIKVVEIFMNYSKKNKNFITTITDLDSLWCKYFKEHENAELHLIELLMTNA